MRARRRHIAASKGRDRLLALRLLFAEACRCFHGIADTAKSASAQVTVTSDISLSVAPGAASVELGAIQAFRGSLVSNGHPRPRSALEACRRGVPGELRRYRRQRQLHRTTNHADVWE